MKKFKITKEQIINLHKSYCLSELKDDLEMIFPDAFKKELIVGKWYKGYNSIFFLTKIENELGYAYGIDEGIWKDECAFKMSLTGKDVEATPQEVEAALICEAKNRGFVDKISFNELEDSENGSIFTEGARVGSCFYLENNKLYTTGRGKWCVFKGGQWATIIETITIQEAEKLLNKKIV